jgi:hypothetical protein
MISSLKIIDAIYLGMACDLKQDVLKQLKSVFYGFKPFFFLKKKKHWSACYSKIALMNKQTFLYF